METINIEEYLNAYTEGNYDNFYYAEKQVSCSTKELDLKVLQEGV